MPLSLNFIFTFITASIGDGCSIFGGLGGKEPSGGGVLPVTMFLNEELKKEDGWLSIGDFKHDI